MTATVIGATGFVGNYLVDLLTGEGTSVSVISNEPRTEMPNYYQADIRDENQIVEALNQCKSSAVYHLAAISSLSGAAREARLAFDVNVWGTRNVMHACSLLSSPPRVLNISSSQVYGGGFDGPLVENSPVAPTSMYAATKAMAEMWRTVYASRVEVMTARSFNHTGPGQSDAFVLPYLVRRVAEIEAGLRPSVIQVGNLQVERDFADVRDVVQAYLAIMRRGRAGEIYNVCSGKYYCLFNLLDFVLSLTTTKVSVEVDKSRFRTQESKRIWGDHSKLTEDTGWQPTLSIEETLRDMLCYWRNKIKVQQQSISQAN